MIYVTGLIVKGILVAGQSKGIASRTRSYSILVKGSRVKLAPTVKRLSSENRNYGRIEYLWIEGCGKKQLLFRDVYSIIYRIYILRKHGIHFTS